MIENLRLIFVPLCSAIFTANFLAPETISSRPPNSGCSKLPTDIYTLIGVSDLITDADKRILEAYQELIKGFKKEITSLKQTIKEKEEIIRQLKDLIKGVI